MQSVSNRGVAWQRRHRQFRTEVIKIRRALRRQVHDDEAVNAAWDALGGDTTKEAEAFEILRDMLARSTGSINNSYLKVQISSGVVVGLIALFLTVFDQQPGVHTGLLTIASIMEAASIGLGFLVTTPRSTTWKQEVKSPGVYAATVTRKQMYLSLSRRAHYNRVVLLGNRRISWLATWALTVPGLVLAMASWAMAASLITLAIIILVAWFYRKHGANRPEGATEYPSP